MQKNKKPLQRTQKKKYQPPKILETFQLEALAVICTDTNAKQEVALGCNPGALFS